MIDIVCFRKLGHNEQDTPALTQPLMYKKIGQHPGTRKLYADRLVAQGVITAPKATSTSPTSAPRWTRAGTRSTRCCRLQEQVRRRLAAVPGPQVARQRRHGGADGRAEAHRPAHHDDAGRFQAASARREGIADRAARWARASSRSTGAWPSISRLRRWSRGLRRAHHGPGLGRGTFTHRHAVLHDQNRERGTRAVTSRCRTLGRAGAVLVIDRCCPRRRCSASSMAIRPPSRTSWSCGRRSSATSSTARRS